MWLWFFKKHTVEEKEFEGKQMNLKMLKKNTIWFDDSDVWWISESDDWRNWKTKLTFTAPPTKCGKLRQVENQNAATDARIMGQNRDRKCKI